jgi:hypothetical protein
LFFFLNAKRVVTFNFFSVSLIQVALQPMTSPNVTGGVTMVTQQQQQQNVSGKGQGKQPQLLPKPAQLAAQVQQQQQQQQQQVTRLLAPTTVTCGSQFVLNTGGNVLTTFSGAQGANTSAPLLLGQMMGSAGSNNTPILIQVNNYLKKNYLCVLLW